MQLLTDIFSNSPISIRCTEGCVRDPLARSLYAKNRSELLIPDLSPPSLHQSIVLQRPVFLVTCSLYTAFQLQGALSRNVATLMSCRLLTGVFGSSRACQPSLLSTRTVADSRTTLFLALTNAGATISDIFNFKERGIASAIYATVPFLGPGTVLVHDLNHLRVQTSDKRCAHTPPHSDWTNCWRFRCRKPTLGMAFQLLVDAHIFWSEFAWRLSADARDGEYRYSLLLPLVLEHFVENGMLWQG